MEEKKQTLDDKDNMTCPKCEEEYPKEAFIGRYDKPTKHCQTCRDKQKALDDKRTTKRNYSLEYKNNPERYEKKQQYKKDNSEKQREYEKKSRAKAKTNANVTSQ